MTTPYDRKTLQVSPAVHARVHDLATELGMSASGVLGRFLDTSSVHLTPSGQQYERWNAAAARGGMSLEEFITARVEAALAFDADPIGLYEIYQRLGEVLDRLPAR